MGWKQVLFLTHASLSWCFVQKMPRGYWGGNTWSPPCKGSRKWLGVTTRWQAELMREHYEIQAEKHSSFFHSSFMELWIFLRIDFAGKISGREGGMRLPGVPQFMVDSFPCLGAFLLPRRLVGCFSVRKRLLSHLDAVAMFPLLLLIACPSFSPSDWWLTRPWSTPQIQDSEGLGWPPPQYPIPQVKPG